MTIEVRPAELRDAPGIAGVHVRGWQETYAHLVPAEDLDRMRVEQRELRWREILTGDDSETWVAADGDVVVGFAGTSPGRDDDSPRPLELQSIYVLASHHGTGAGQRLLDAALGDRPAFLWVARDNPRANAFYARNGFGPDGATDTHSLLGTPVEAIRLVR
jgi:ribosomal protein S18 acetylase RimI-like enzyme